MGEKITWLYEADADFATRRMIYKRYYRAKLGSSKTNSIVIQAILDYFVTLWKIPETFRSGWEGEVMAEILTDLEQGTSS